MSGTVLTVLIETPTFHVQDNNSTLDSGVYYYTSSTRLQEYTGTGTAAKQCLLFSYFWPLAKFGPTSNGILKGWKRTMSIGPTIKRKPTIMAPSLNLTTLRSPDKLVPATR